MQKDFQRPRVGWPGDQEGDALLLLAAKAQGGGKSLVVCAPAKPQLGNSGGLL